MFTIAHRVDARNCEHGLSRLLTFCSRAKSCTVDEANKLRYIFVQREFALTQKNDEINSLCREIRVSRTQPKQK